MSVSLPEEGLRRTILRRDAVLPAPLSFAQERMVLLEQLTPGVTAYNVPRLFKIAGRLDADLLRQAFDTVVARHEPLRTTIALVEGAPVLHVAEEGSIELGVVDVVAAADPIGEATLLIDELAWQPFDLERDLMLKARLLRVSDDEDWLLIVSHHLVSDYASTPILLAELAEAYAALTAGREPSLPDLPIRYADFAAWQRERLSGPVLEESLAYWRQRLAGAPERLDLPADRARPAVKTYRGAQLSHSFAPELVAGLRALARSNGVSLYVVLLAAVKTLLHRYTGAEDVVVGSAVTGRHHEETMPLIGFFTNTLVLRTSLEGDPPFTELLARVRETTFGAYAHQELPFEKLVEALNPQRDLSHSPFFQVLFTHDIAFPPFELGGFPVTPELPAGKWSRFDLALGTRERLDGGLDLNVEYSTDLFERETIERLLGHLEMLLLAVAENPDRPIGGLPLLTPEERGQLLVDWNATESPIPELCLHELVSAQAERTPGAVAVEGETGQLTYAELDARSNQLARHLVALGAEPETLVGVCTERVPELLVALLGVLKTGAAYVPIDPTYPAERQAFMLVDSAAPILVTQEVLLERLPPHEAAVVCLDRDRAEIAALPADPVAVAADPEALAYVIYTSGSTGRPKGVEIRHRSVVNLLESMRRHPGLSKDDVLVNVTTSAFDLSVPDLYLALVCGARLVVLSREATLDARKLTDAFARAEASFVQATPTTWGMLVESGWEGLLGLKIVCGGEALPRSLANDLVGRGAELWHMYGPTETTVWSSILRLERGEGPSPVGGPIANTRFYVVDSNLQPVALRIPGELLIGGVGVARGYRNLPELTSDRFIPDPFEGQGSERVYRTGDQVRQRADGTLEFLGRLDQQVKLHGFRIELEEIEAVLDRHPEVRASVAALRDDAEGGKLLVGYAVLEPAAAVTTGALRRYLSTSLPAYMVPSVIVPLTELPVTANGKLDRSALPAPSTARPALDLPYVPPRTPVEEQVAANWAALLPVDRVGIDDNFFDLGGHSMLALRLVARIQDTFDVDLLLTAVFEHPTVRDLAEVVSTRMLEDAADDGLDTLLDELEAAGT